MIVLPNKNKVNTDDIIDLVKVILKESQEQIEFANAKGWCSDEVNAPDLVTIDSDGDFHLIHVVVSGEELDDEIAIAKKLAKKKMCKQEAIEFNNDFDDEINEEAYICVDIVFLTTLRGIEVGKLHGINRYNKKACEL